MTSPHGHMGDTLGKRKAMVHVEEVVSACQHSHMDTHTHTYSLSFSLSKQTKVKNTQFINMGNEM